MKTEAECMKWSAQRPEKARQKENKRDGDTENCSVC